jgi:glutaconate CoA-transferase subunit B
VITDLGVLRPAAGSEELTLVACYEGVSPDTVRAATGWPLRIAAELEVISPPTADELSVLRELQARTKMVHSRPVEVPGK